MFLKHPMFFNAYLETGQDYYYYYYFYFFTFAVMKYLYSHVNGDINSNNLSRKQKEWYPHIIFTSLF